MNLIMYVAEHKYIIYEDDTQVEVIEAEAGIGHFIHKKIRRMVFTETDDIYDVLRRATTCSVFSERMNIDLSDIRCYRHKRGE